MEINLGCDFHCHLRQGLMMETIVPMIQSSGINTVLVMPNLHPPITTTQKAHEYRLKLLTLSPATRFLMTLYLSPNVTPLEIKTASESRFIVAVKMYPKSTTTNSEDGVEDIFIYYETLKAMEKYNIVLCLHGESSKEDPLFAEQLFLPILIKLNHMFPNMRIVLEHVSSKYAIECILSLGQNVAGTITPHHLCLTSIDCNNPHNFCKPIPKSKMDQEALIGVIKSGNPKFFLGSDSAPHLCVDKLGNRVPAGIFTTPILMPLVATLFSRFGCLDKLESFTSTNGLSFYNIPRLEGKIRILKLPYFIPYFYHLGKTDTIVPFMNGQELDYILIHDSKL
jgi:dihydroorotase